MAIHAKFQRQLEGAKCLDLAHDKEVIVKEGVDYGKRKIITACWYQAA